MEQETKFFFMIKDDDGNVIETPFMFGGKMLFPDEDGKFEAVLTEQTQEELEKHAESVFSILMQMGVLTEAKKIRKNNCKTIIIF